MFDDIELKKILKKSIEDFYEKDYYLVKKNLHEQSETHRIAHYLENNVQEYLKIKDYSIDVEYNKTNETAKELYKECENCTKKCICNHKPSQYTGRPDIIFHIRGKNGIDNNLLVVEAKKNSDIGNDNKKLAYLTCEKAKYEYQLGACIVLREEQVTITYFKNHIEEKTRIGKFDKGWGILWQEEKLRGN